MRSARRNPLLQLATLIALLTLAACLRPIASPSSARAQSERLRHTQDVWIISSLQTTDAAGKTVDLTPALKEAVAAQLDPPIALSSTLSYQKSEALGGRLIDAGGNTLASIAVQVGEITVVNSDGSSATVVAVLATPDVAERAAGIGPRDGVALDLSALAGATEADSAQISYALLQLPPPVQAEASNQSDEAVAAQRYAAGGAQMLSVDVGNGTREAAVTPGLATKLQHGPGLSAGYLRAGGVQQSGPALEGVFGALDALSLDPAQLLPIAPDTGEDAVPGAAIVRGLAQNATLIDGAQGLTNTTVCGDGQTANCTPAPQPAAPAPTSDCVLANGCVFDGTGMIAWPEGLPSSGHGITETDWVLTFSVTIPPSPSGGTTASASGSYTEHYVTTPDCTPPTPVTSPMTVAAQVAADGTLQLTLGNVPGRPPLHDALSCSAFGPSPALGDVFLPDNIPNPFVLPVRDGATAAGTIHHPVGPDSGDATITLTLHYRGATP